MWVISFPTHFNLFYFFILYIEKLIYHTFRSEPSTILQQEAGYFHLSISPRYILDGGCLLRRTLLVGTYLTKMIYFETNCHP